MTLQSCISWQVTRDAIDDEADKSKARLSWKKKVDEFTSFLILGWICEKKYLKLFLVN